MRLLVTDADTRAALAAARSLGRRHVVHVAGSGRTSLAAASRFSAEHHRVADPLAAPEAFAEAVCALVREARLDLVLPVSDAATLALLRRRDELAPARLVAAEADAYARLSDKHALVDLARRAGLETPEGERAGDLASAGALARALGFPIVVKPVVSVVRDAAGRLRKPEVTRVDAAEGLADAFERAAVGGEALLQRCIRGWGEGISVLRWGGRTLAAFAHRRLREQPPGGGVSVLAESLPIDPGRLARVESILAGIGYEGLAMAEFKSDGERAFLIEFNARLWGSVQLAIDAGVDFPSLLLDACAGAPTAAPPQYRTGMRLRSELGDLDHALALARNRGAPGSPGGLLAALGVVLRPAGPRCRWELLRREDPRPFGRALLHWIGGRPL